MQRLHDHFPALCRLYAGGDAIVSWYNAFSDSRSRLSQIAQTQDGGALIWIMGFVGVLIVLDVLMNDWTPARIRIGDSFINVNWKRAFKYRHFLFVALAFCYVAQPFVAERAGYGVSLLVYFYWQSFQSITLAFFDAKQRSRSQGWQRVLS